MCGIAGYSISPKSSVDRTRAAQALLAAIAERGADAVGYAFRSPGGPLSVHKQRTGASAVLDQIAIPADAHQVLLHVRDYTKGHPQIAANNHPVRHGSVVGVHNGTILNDDELMARHGFERAEPEMTVDSEVIFATAEANGSDARAFEDFRGSMAAAWLDERHPDLLYLARGVGRPLWVGTSRRELFFASTARGARDRRALHGCPPAQARACGGDAARVEGPPRRPPRPLQARSDLRGRPAAGRSRTRRRCLLPPAARRVSRAG